MSTVCPAVTWAYWNSICQGGKVRRRVNGRRRCNLRFAVENLGRANARTEGDTAREGEEHRIGRGVKPDLGDAGGLRPAEHAATPAADVGGRSGRRAWSWAVRAAERHRPPGRLSQWVREAAAAEPEQRDDHALPAAGARAERALREPAAARLQASD